MKSFSTWGAIAVAAIGKLPPTWMTRSIKISLRRKLASERVEQIRETDATLWAELNELARQIQRWVRDGEQAIADARPEMPASLYNRAADNWVHLFAIADAAGGEWPKRARAAAGELSGKRTDDSLRAQALSDIREVFTQRAPKNGNLPSSTICADLAQREDRPWNEYRRGKPITQIQLAALLKPYGIFPAGTVRLDDDTTAKGYKLEDFTDTFDRYLDADVAKPPEKLNESEPPPAKPKSRKKRKFEK